MASDIGNYFHGVGQLAKAQAAVKLNSGLRVVARQLINRGRSSRSCGAASLLFSL